MRIVLATMNDIGKYALAELVEFVEVVGLFTVKERGRLYMHPSDFTDLARKHGIPLYRIADVNAPEVAEQMTTLRPDLGMCLGWKQVIRRTVLRLPRYGWIGGHPAYLMLKGERPDRDTFSARGNEPIQYAIRGGFRRTGMSLQWLKVRIDEGELFARGAVEIDDHETSATLVQKMGRLTGRLLREQLPSLVAGRPPRLPQEYEHQQPYTKPLLADDNRIDLATPVDQTYRLIRSEYFPYPNAFIEFHGQRLYIEHARMENGAFTELKVRVGGSPYAGGL